MNSFLIPTFTLRKGNAVDLSFQCSWMDFVEESFYLWHSDITSAARHYLIWAYPPSDFLISLQYGLALYDAHIWRSPATRGQWGHFWKSKHSLREWESFQRREERSQECHRSGPTMGGSCFGGSGHILGSFPSYFIHNGLRRTEILESSSANIWKIFCSSKRPRSLLGKSTTAEI